MPVRVKIRRHACRIYGPRFAHGFLIRHLPDDQVSITIDGRVYLRRRRRSAIGEPTFHPEDWNA